MAFGQGGDAFKVAVASAIEGNVNYFITKQFEFDHLRAYSFRFCYDRSQTAVECIADYLHMHFVILMQR